MTAARDDAPVRLGPATIPPLFRESFPTQRLLVVSNREPYEHRWNEEIGEIEVRRPTGGLTSALDPVLQAIGGTWIAWGSGDADREVADARGRMRIPPEAPRYTLRRVWLSEQDVQFYYLGFANQFLWPLCHLRPALTRVRARHWEQYRRVNKRFADAVLQEAEGAEAAVWFQDYHLALTPGYVRARRPDLTLAHFWHIPWPPLDIFTMATQARPLLEGLLANDLMGFQVSSFCANFLHCAQEVAGADVDWSNSTARLGDHVCHVRPLPISTDVDAFTRAAARPDAERHLRRLRARYLPDEGQLGLGVDRMDYSKGLPEKLKALDFLWERNPELRGRFTFVQVAVPSRTNIHAYDDLTHKVERLVWSINDRYGTSRWRPVHLIKQPLPRERLAIMYRAADLAVISSLHDGMNLVAKEYVASQIDARGVLLLSRFAGAAEELNRCIEINPYDPEDFAQRLRAGLLMPAAERRERMIAMQESLRTIYDWMADVFQAWGRITAARDSVSAPA